MSKFITFFCIFSVLFFAASYARADSYHGIVYEPTLADTTINNYYDSKTVINNTIANEGSALASSFSGVDCNMSSDKWHGGGSVAQLNDVIAPSGGICKRWEDIMLKFQAGKAGDTEAVVFSFMANFE